MSETAQLNRHLHNPRLPGAAFALEGSGPDAVLLFHGFTATPNEVLGLGLALQKAGYSVFGPLLAGHGTHPRDLNRVRWQDWAQQAEQCFDDLALRSERKYRRIIVGGESNGGLTALHLAAARPQAAAVLAYAPALRLPFSRLEHFLLRVLAPLGVMLPKGDLKGETRWQGYHVNPLRATQQLLRYQDAVRALLPQVCQPTLIVQGGADTTVDPAGAAEVYQGIGSTVKEMRQYVDAPHCLLIWREQQSVFDLTLEFLSKLPE